MGSSIIQIALFALGGCTLGAAGAWMYQAIISQRRISNLTIAANTKLDEVTAQRDQFAREYPQSRVKIETLQTAVVERNTTIEALQSSIAESDTDIESLQSLIAQHNIEMGTLQADIAKRNTKVKSLQTEVTKRNTEIAKRNTEFESVLKNSKVLVANIATLRTEREGTKSKLSGIHKTLIAFRQQTAALQSEFQKSQELYKRELQKSFEKRKLLENEMEEAQSELKDALSEQETFVETVETTTADSGSSDEVVVAARLRLGQIEVLERTVSKLEGENELLNNDIVRLRQEYESQQKDLVELEELRVNNRQLVQGVEALEESRQEHETDAERYRQQADQSERLSDTLRFRLDDLQQGFADIEKQQGKALQSARKAAVVPLLRNRG
jgi:chromosome segregation ATPase